MTISTVPQPTRQTKKKQVIRSLDRITRQLPIPGSKLALDQQAIEWERLSEHDLRTIQALLRELRDGNTGGGS